MSGQQPSPAMSSTAIPSVSAMDEIFNVRMRAYASAFASREVPSRESTIEAHEEPDNNAPKQKRNDSTNEGEETTEEPGEEEAPISHKIILKINFTNNIILSVDPAPKRQRTQPAEQEASASRASSARRPPTPHPQMHRRLRPRRDREERRPSLRPLRPNSTTTTTTTTKIAKTSTITTNATGIATAKHTTTAIPKIMKHNLRSRRPLSSPSTSPPQLPIVYIGNEKEERWDPIPLPSPLLPDDTEGPKAAWARLFPHEKPFGEYGGKPTGWMERMCWKDGKWRARGPEEPYVERFLGRKGDGIGLVEVELSWKRG
ncbi:hypothetical protein yc1106_03995 [Curvularia clavata]|uniref:Uncharacterized protein n=1 Tax=Curvularia clavata TaxID=95742 RepID=A0A9Q8Z5I8_CURCL|nr:hypothetical protein yc1106_03995 [Curvularia clavata]